MKHKALALTLLIILALCFAATFLYFLFQNISAGYQEAAYFDIYKAQAEDYIKSDPEMIRQYGNDFSIKFGNTISYSTKAAPRNFFERCLSFFSPDTPESFEEFSKQLASLTLRCTVNKEAYEITCLSNEKGELVISSLNKVNK